MNKSNYEIYAEKRQRGLMQKEMFFQSMFGVLKSNKGIFSKEYMEAQIDLVASLFDLLSEEVERAVSGQEYWCV